MFYVDRPASETNAEPTSLLEHVSMDLRVERSPTRLLFARLLHGRKTSILPPNSPARGSNTSPTALLLASAMHA